MGKKGSCFSSIKRVLVPSCNRKQLHKSGEQNTKETKKAQTQRHGETKLFIPIFKEPSSIEKILGEADQQNLLIPPSATFEPPKTPPAVTPGAASPEAASSKAASPEAASSKAASPEAASSKAASSEAASSKPASPKATSARPRAAAVQASFPGASSQRAASPKDTSSRDVSPRKEVTSLMPEPTSQIHNLLATKIQAAYRGYTARRSFGALRGLVRLQGVLRGSNVKQQTANAMKMMQVIVRVQNQIQLERTKKLENLALRRQTYKIDKELESILGRWAAGQSEAGNQDDWDGSTVAKEERVARKQKKMEGLIKRQRVIAYAYSHQSWKSGPKSAQASVPDDRLGGFPWWWNWLDRQFPTTDPPKFTPEPKLSLQPTTPTSTRSMVPSRSNHFISPKYSSGSVTFPKPKMGSVFEFGAKDGDSLASCPQFWVPNYLSPTASSKAKAKARGSSSPRERSLRTPGYDSKRRFSYPLTPST